LRRPRKEEQEQPEQFKAGLLLGKALMLGDPRLAHPANVVRRAELLRASQRALGNRAVQRLLQTKLKIDRSGRKYSKVAAPVTKAARRMPEPGVQRQPREEEEEETLQALPPPKPVTPKVQRQARLEKEEEPAQTRRDYEATPGRTRGMMMRREPPFGPGQYCWRAIAGRRLPNNAQAVVNLSAPSGMVQRDNDKDKKETGGGGPAAPTLSVDPGEEIERGKTVTLTVNFKANAGETLKVTGWQFASSGGVTVNRPEAHAAKTEWEGPLVVPGKVVVGYSVQPAEGEAVTGQLKQQLKITPRTGGVWESELTPRAEKNSGSGTPQRYKDLGRHETDYTEAEATARKISSGPNKGFTYVKSLRPGQYISQPYIHPALKSSDSAFYKFHVHGSLLYVVNVDDEQKKTLVPTSDYSDFKSVGEEFTFNVPDWTGFYQKYDILKVVGMGVGDKEVPCKDSWWELESQAKNAKPKVKAGKEAEVRAALGIGPDEEPWLLRRFARTYSVTELIKSADLKKQTRRHEFAGEVHSHRANFTRILNALDPQRTLEEMVFAPDADLDWEDIDERYPEIKLAAESHDLVHEKESMKDGSFMTSGDKMYDVNQDEDGNFLGAPWNISEGKAME